MPHTDLADPAALGELIDGARRDVFRLETLDSYAVASDGGDYGRWLAGEPAPDPGRKAGAHQWLRSFTDRGVTFRRVHIVRSPLSDYLRYEMDWGYGPNSAYEEIRILDLAERPWPGDQAPDEDFWLIDGTDVAIMDYDEQNRYCGFRHVTTSGPLGYRAAEIARTAWDAAEPYARYWAAHPQFWRTSAA